MEEYARHVCSLAHVRTSGQAIAVAPPNTSAISRCSENPAIDGRYILLRHVPLRRGRALLSTAPLQISRMPEAMKPPSTGITWPLMYDESSDARKATAPAISAGVP